MAVKGLEDLLSTYAEVIRGRLFNTKAEKEVLFQLAKSNGERYESFLERISETWNEFQERNRNYVLKKTFTTYFYLEFDRFFKEYLSSFFRFNEDSLHLIKKEKLSDSVLLVEYAYEISPFENEIFEVYAKQVEGNLPPNLFLTGLLFFIVTTLGITIHETIKERVLISLDCARVENGQEQRVLKFLILIRKSDEKFFRNYFNMTLYYFLKQFKGIPDQFYETLIKKRNDLHEIALKEYPNTQERLIDLLYYFYKKCKLLGHFCPILDLLNFVCSRVEDSKFSKLDIIKKDFLRNFDYSEAKKNSIIKIFNFLDEKSTLYSTFQANNLPSPRNQFNLFILLMRYFFATGLEMLEIEGGLLLMPDSFKSKLDEYNKTAKNVIDSQSIQRIGVFTNFLSSTSSITGSKFFLKKVFKKDLSALNYRLFRTYLKSYNAKLSDLIDSENNYLKDIGIDEGLTFNVVADHVCRILYVLVDKIFIRSSPDEASKNFHDWRSRYVGKNIALRVHELFLFQEINFSDDIWPEYLISLKKENVKKVLKPFVDIPDNKFYSDYELTRFLTTYNLHSFDNEIFFEEWLLFKIIIPINDFIWQIKDKVNDLNDLEEVYEALKDYLLKDLEEVDEIEEISRMVKHIAPFWVNSF